MFVTIDEHVADIIGVRHDKDCPYPIIGRNNFTHCCRCGKSFSEVKQCAQDFQHCVTCRLEWDVEYKASSPAPPYSKCIENAFQAATAFGLFDDKAILAKKDRLWRIEIPSKNYLVAESDKLPMAICCAIMVLNRDKNICRFIHDFADKKKGER